MPSDADPQVAADDLPIVAIGASAGGLEALREVFQASKDKTGIAYVVIQHLDPNHESLMAQLLERYTPMKVMQAAGGERIEADHVYVIPPGHGLAINDRILQLTDFRDPRGLRRPIDDFFESLAEDRGPRAACVILSGTGADGSRGLRAIKEFGGLAVAQDPTSARYDGMPVSAIGTGLVDVVARPGEVIECLCNFFERADAIELDAQADDTLDHIDEMCKALQDAIGHDFARYKRTTLTRRIARRMQVLGLDNSGDYLGRLRSDGRECEALFRDLLINVTRFFRDRDEFNRFDELVIDPLIAASRDAREVRLWVAGCSSGEEAYSIAILVAEAMRRHERRPYVQIFATDIDEKMLEIARSGTYPLAALGDIPPEIQSAYLDIGTDHFTISPRIRDMVRFSSHNLVRDPPYAKVDVVTCRNLLIYFDEDLQREVIPLFHFALNSEGKLFLGSSESIGRFEELFKPLDERARIFERRDAVGRYVLRIGTQPRRPQPVTQQRKATRPGPTIETLALQRIADRYAPVSLLVDSEGMLLEQWGSATRYLDFPDRIDQRLDVTRLVKPGLREVVGPLLRETVREDKRKFVREVNVQTDFGLQPVQVLAEPVDGRAYLLVIRELGPLQPGYSEEFDEYVRGEGELRFLQEELQTARLRLRTTVEELETANEELKSSNEEMMSMNEELQSTNEELTTVNDELKAKIDQLTVANADVRNFFESTQLAVLVVDRDLNLRSFTDAAQSIFAVDSASIGRPLVQIHSRLADRQYIDSAGKAARTGTSEEFRVATDGGKRQFIARILPYRHLDGTTAGATLVFTDVSDALTLEKELAEERARLQMALDVAQIGVWQYEPSSGETELDDTERRLLGLDTSAATIQMDKVLDNLPPDDRDRVNSALLKALDGINLYDEVFRVNMPDGEVRWLHGLGQRLDLPGNRKFIGVTYDVTAEREALAQRDLMIREMNHRVKNLFAVISALTALSARQATSIETFSADLRSRIHALGQSHALTADRPGGEVTLSKMIETVLAPIVREQTVCIEGAEFSVPNRLVTPLALILHEWTTNSTKYGALSVEDGRLEITVTTDQQIVIDWREFGGQPAPETPHEGFGTRLVEVSAMQLRAQAEAGPTEDGFRRTLCFENYLSA